jgi:hypothetical protein
MPHSVSVTLMVIVAALLAAPLLIGFWSGPVLSPDLATQRAISSNTGPQSQGPDIIRLRNG